MRFQHLSIQAQVRRQLQPAAGFRPLWIVRTAPAIDDTVLPVLCLAVSGRQTACCAASRLTEFRSQRRTKTADTRIARLHPNAPVLLLSQARIGPESFWFHWQEGVTAGEAAYPDSAANERLQGGDDKQENSDASC